MRAVGHAALWTLFVLPFMGETGYQTSLEQWREHRETVLKADDGWLTVAGLFWLKDGINTAGSDQASDIVLPSGPAKAGVFEFHAGHTTFRPPQGAARELKADSDDQPDQVQSDNLIMFVIHRGNRYAIRLKDTASKLRKEFTGLHWFPVKASYRVTAKFVPYDPPKMLSIPNVLGETERQASPGYVVFTLQGQSLRLDPVVEGKELFFIFHDQTSGNPPKQNRLPIRIEAGELNYGHH